MCRWGRVFRLRASSCAAGGTPRPETHTLIYISVWLGERGDGEDGVSMPGRQTEGLAKCSGADLISTIGPGRVGHRPIEIMGLICPWTG